LTACLVVKANRAFWRKYSKPDLRSICPVGYNNSFTKKEDNENNNMPRVKSKKINKTKKEKVAGKLPIKKASKTSAKKPALKVEKKLSRPETNSVLPKIQPKQVKPVKTSAQPQTMEELLAKTGYKLRGLRRGETVEGTITDIGKKKLLIDIGAKTEGVVLEKEYELSRDFIRTMKVGDKIRVIVGMPENERGQILLSLRRAAEDYKWDTFEKYLKTGTEIEVRGLDVNKGGMIARIMDVYGFVPVSQFGRAYLGNLDKLYNKVFKVKVIEVGREKNRLIFSEKAVSEAQALASQGKALEKVKVGDTLEGVISGIMPFGVFVRVNIEAEGKKTTKKKPTSKDKSKEDDQEAIKESQDQPELQGMFLEGLVHISEISWEKVENLNKIFKVGEKIKVKVLGIDKESTRLNLSVKQLQPDPWTTLAKKYPPEKKLKGKVTKLAAFGAFVSLEEGVEGLIHISKIPADFAIKVGDKVDVYIENIDLEHHRIALGLVLAKKPVGYK